MILAKLYRGLYYLDVFHYWLWHRAVQGELKIIQYFTYFTICLQAPEICGKLIFWHSQKRMFISKATSQEYSPLPFSIVWNLIIYYSVSSCLGVHNMTSRNMPSLVTCISVSLSPPLSRWLCRPMKGVKDIPVTSHPWQMHGGTSATGADWKTCAQSNSSWPRFLERDTALAQGGGALFAPAGLALFVAELWTVQNLC